MAKRSKLFKLFYIFITFKFSAAASYAVDIDELRRAQKEHRIVLVSDFDSTLTGPAWMTPWVLKKINAVNGYFDLLAPKVTQPNFDFNQLPDEILISEQEFYNKVKNKLAVVERSGSATIKTHDAMELVELPMIGRDQKINFYPGFYRLTPDSFRYFKTQQTNQLLIDNQFANKVVKLSKNFLSKFGIAFPIFQSLLKDIKNIRNVHILTARGQAAEEFTQGLFTEWKKEGVLENIEGDLIETRSGGQRASVQIHALGLGEAILYGSDLPEKKRRFLHEAIISQYTMNTNDKNNKWILIVAEDNPEILREYNKLFLELSGISNYREKFEFVLMSAGTEQELKLSELPSRTVYYEKGFAIALNSESADFLTGDLNSKKSKRIREAGVENINLKNTKVRANKCLQVLKRRS